MNKISKFFLCGCAYTVLIEFLFLLFAKMSAFTDAKFGLSQFFIIFIFGLLISVAGEILNFNKINVFLRYLIHYTVLFLAFLVVFIINGNISAKGGSAILSAVVIFSFFYFLILLFVYVIKKAMGISVKKSENTTDRETKTRGGYTPRFK